VPKGRPRGSRASRRVDASAYRRNARPAAARPRTHRATRHAPGPGTSDNADCGGVVGVADQPAGVALLDVPAECRGATLLDRRHDAPFNPAEMDAVVAAERLALVAEHVRHLQRGMHRTGAVWGVTSSRSRSSGLGVRPSCPRSCGGAGGLILVIGGLPFQGWGAAPKPCQTSHPTHASGAATTASAVVQSREELASSRTGITNRSYPQSL
jgi:hypothetical protein